MGFFSDSWKQQATSTAMPVEPQQYSGLFSKIMEMIMGRMGSSADLSGYAAGGVQDINKTFDAAQGSLENSLTSRGLSASPIAGQSDIQREIARAGQIGQFRAGLPMLQRQLQGQDLGTAMQFFGQRPLGQTTTSSASGSQQSSIFDQMAKVLGSFMGQGLFKGGGLGGQNPLGN